MRFAARMIAIMAFAFLLAPALCAGDAAKPAAGTKKVEAANPRVEPGAEAKAAPAAVPAATLPATAAPQSSAGDNNTPKVELFLGYSYVRGVPESLKNRIVRLHGGNGSLAFNVNRYLGLVADFAGYRSDELRLTGAGTPPSFVVDADGTVFTYMFGPRLSYRNNRVTPFAHALFGVAHAGEVSIAGCTGPACTPLPSENVFAMALGGGLDVKVHRNVAFRVIQAEYLMTRFRDPSPGAGETGTRSNLRLGAGIVFLFGGNPPPPPPPPNRSPVAQCSASPNSVYVGPGTTVAVRAESSDPDGDSLTYAWSASQGTLDGSGPVVRWSSAGLAAGQYVVNARVSDGKGGTASCEATILVEAKPNTAPTISCTANRTSVLAGERVRISATTQDSDGDPLTVAWRASAGQVIGTGSTVELDTSGLSEGRYRVTGRVEDGRGGAADCEVGVNVTQPPPAPQSSKINECFFREGSARVDNVCKRILDDVALRLNQDPSGRVVLVGFADPNEPRAARLGADRTAQVAKYMEEKGITGSRLERRTGTGQAGATKENRRLDIIWLPAGATF